MTLDEFQSKYLGKTLGYPDGSFTGECLSLVKVYIKERWGFNPPPSGSNSAYGYWANFPSPLGDYFTKVPNTPEAVPQQGDIIIWNTKVGNGYGHIAIFLEGTVSRFTSLDQNWNGKQTHLQEHTYDNVVGWLHPKGIMADMYKGYDLSNRESMMVAVDVLVRLQAGEFVDKSVYEKEVQEHKKTAQLLDEAREQISTLNDELESSAVDMDLWAVNGLTVEVTENNTKTITNYKLK